MKAAVNARLVREGSAWMSKALRVFHGEAARRTPITSRKSLTTPRWRTICAFG